MACGLHSASRCNHHWGRHPPIQKSIKMNLQLLVLGPASKGITNSQPLPPPWPQPDVGAWGQPPHPRAAEHRPPSQVMENRLDSTQPILNYLNWVPGRVGRGGTEEDPDSLQALESGQVPEGPCDLRQVSHPLWASDIPHLSESHLGLSGLVGRAWGLEDRYQAYHLPPHPAPHLVDHPINLHRDDEVGIVHWL